MKLGLDQDFIKSRYRGEKEKQEMEYLQNLKRMPVPRLTSGMCEMLHYFFQKNFITWKLKRRGCVDNTNYCITISGMIGWRSSDPECWIDMSGLMYVSDKTYPLSEPTQSLHEQWKCIWLG